MSKNYLQQRRYDAKHYQEPSPYIWIGPFRFFVGQKKDVNEPEWRTLAHLSYIYENNHNNQAKYWRINSKRKFRRLTKRLIKQGRYDELPHKLENIDYRLC